MATDKPTRAQMIKLLNEDLSREYQAIIAYVIYSQVLKGAEYMAIADELKVHAKEELDHALKIANQIDYLGGMPSSISTPRLAQPRRHTPAGSVAIGGDHTGIYPVASPGGWRVIGRTPLEIFRAERAPITLIQMGDHVRFVPLA